MFSQLTTWASVHPEQAIPAFTAFLALVFGGLWTALTFLQKMHSDNEEKILERYRRLSQEITEGREGDESPFIAYQLDAVYSLRFYPKYYSRSIWMLKEIVSRWSNSKSYNDEHINEVKETLVYIAHRKNIVGRLVFGLFNLVWFFRLKSSVIVE